LFKEEVILLEADAEATAGDLAHLAVAGLILLGAVDPAAAVLEAIEDLADLLTDCHAEVVLDEVLLGALRLSHQLTVVDLVDDVELLVS